MLFLALLAIRTIGLFSPICIIQYTIRIIANNNKKQKKKILQTEYSISYIIIND